MKKFILLFCFIAWVFVALSQQTSENMAKLKLYITDLQNKPLITRVTLKSKTNFYSGQTDSKGIAVITVKAGDEYRIRIPQSLMYYDYGLDDFPDMELTANLKFDISQNLENAANDEQALIIVSIQNLPNGRSVELIEEKSGKVLKKSHFDELKFAVPIDKNYLIKVGGVMVNNNLIKVDKTPFRVMYFVLYFSDEKSASLIPAENNAFIHVRYTNIFTKLPAPGEQVFIESVKAKKTYTGITNTNGTYLFAIPKNESYSVHLPRLKNILNRQIENREELIVVECDLSFPGSKDLDQNWALDSIRLVQRDKEYKKLALAEIKDDRERLKTEISGEVTTAKENLKQDPKYFEKNGNTVCSVVFRLKKDWNSKMIVTDLTSSQYPYLRELLLWHQLKLIANEDNDFVFFNDGNGKPDEQKQIGKTGGMYYTDSDEALTVISKMFETMKNGNGGDGPENDIEALLFAKSKMKKNAELILIADNYSPVKDICLVDQLKVPVRIILCGAEGTIHPDYVEIAWKTKGSIHTIQEDIEMLQKLVDGQKLKIGDESFIFSGGKFFRELSHP